jgi:hypothetical protein
MTKSELQYYLFYGMFWLLDKIKHYWRRLTRGKLYAGKLYMNVL